MKIALINLVSGSVRSLIIIIIFLLLSPNDSVAQGIYDAPAIIPIPVMSKKNEGHYILKNNITIYATRSAEKSAIFLGEFLKNERGIDSKIVFNNNLTRKASNGIFISDGGHKNLPMSGYKLTVSKDRIQLIGNEKGAFYGIQTLIQLFPMEKAHNILPCMVIEDYPRFAYRGLMLDVSRHFFTIDYIKKLIDLMASYKLNTFHWHLVDNEGWRIEIKKYPRLTEIGGYRKITGIGKNRDWFDDIPYGGYYTQEEIKDVINFASDRFIEVIPEIEMPAHSLAALQAYPEYKVEPEKNGKKDGAYDIIYKPSEETFKFLENILTEVIALFPSKYIHIGGDEANKKPWEESAFCNQLMKDLKLEDAHALQSYFIQRIEKFLNSKGKSIIGWDEILEGGLAPNATVMSWRGETGGISAAKQKHNVIMSPGSKGMYFDYYQSKSIDQEPVNIGGYAPLSQTYNYDPVPESLNQDERKYILGVQGNIWTEYISTPAKIEYMTFPRLLALAEVAWSPVDKKNYQDFALRRMPVHLAILEAKAINFRVPTAIGVSERDTVLTGDHFTFTLQPSMPGATIYYSLNGRIPDNTDLEYKNPLVFKIPENENRELRTVVITSSGKRSIATHTVMTNKVTPQLTK